MSKARKAAFVSSGLMGGLMVFFGLELLYITHNGTPVAAPTIPRAVQKMGSGPELNYVIMGDSTAIGQGAPYSQSYAYQSTKYLAKTHTVSVQNVAISGGRAASVLTTQLSKIQTDRPDIVLLAVGANDVTHLTSQKSFEAALQEIIAALRTHNPSVKIVVTGVPAMGSIPRFPWPLKQLAGARTNQLNKTYDRLAADKTVILAPIAAKTGSVFRANPQLFAQDKFHPNAEGYALWTPVINTALNQALHR